MSKFTISIHLDHAKDASDLVGIAEIFTSNGFDRLDPKCLIGLLLRLDLGTQRGLWNSEQEPSPMMGKLDETDARPWLYIADKLEELSMRIRENVGDHQ